MSTPVVTELTPVQDLFRDLLEVMQAEDPIHAGNRLMVGPGGPVTSLPAARYLDEHRCQREMATLFRRYPLLIGHAGQLPPGHCMSHDALGLPLLLSNDDGRIRVFLNQCSHRGTRLLNDESPCARKSIRCPYHHWNYGLDGSLRSLPQPQGFPGLDRSTLGLVELPAQVRNGLLFLLPDRDADLQLEAFLGPMGTLLDEMETGEYHFFRHTRRRWACNWKLPFDAFLEAYHLHRLHRDTLAPLFKDNRAQIRPIGQHLAAAVARTGIEAAFEQTPEQWELRNRVTMTWFVLPNTVIIYHPDYTSIVSFYPVSAGSSWIDHSMLVNEEPLTDKARAHWERAFEMTDARSFGDEDFFIAEQMQAGLAAGARDQIVLGAYEQSIAYYHRRLDQMMAAADRPEPD